MRDWREQGKKHSKRWLASYKEERESGDHFLPHRAKERRDMKLDSTRCNEGSSYTFELESGGGRRKRKEGRKEGNKERRNSVFISWVGCLCG